MNKLVEIKILEKERLQEDNISYPFSLHSLFNHPERYRHTNCYQREDGKIATVGSTYYIEFIDGYCPNFFDFGEAWILGEISMDRAFEDDRFYPINKPMKTVYFFYSARINYKDLTDNYHGTVYLSGVHRFSPPPKSNELSPKIIKVIEDGLLEEKGLVAENICLLALNKIDGLEDEDN